MNQPLKRFSIEWRGVWLALGTVICVMAWRGWVVAQKPANAREIADEIGSIWQVPSALFPNHANTHLTFQQYTETGVGIFFSDTSGGKKTLVVEQLEKDSGSWQKFGMLGWSPDDRLFACAYPPNDPKQPGEIIIIGNGTNGAVVAKLEASFLLSELAWLSPRSFAYSFFSGDARDLVVIEQRANGDWAQTQTLKGIGNKETTGLTATSARSVAWRQGKEVWGLDFADGIQKKIWETTARELIGFAYSTEFGEFLFNCKDENGQFLIRYNPKTQTTEDLGRMAEGTPEIRRVTWLNRAPAYAYRKQTVGGDVFSIETGAGGGLDSVSVPGDTYDFVLNGDRLYLAGTLTNSRPGVWAYDLESKELSNLGSSLDRSLRYARIVSATAGQLTNQSGVVRNYYTWPPAHFSSRKKYPAIISQSIGGIGGGVSSQFAPNMGYFAVLVQRPGWGEGLDTWQDDVMTAREILAQNPNIDTQRIYLSGASAETHYMNQLIAEKPDLWRGAILLSPSALPDLTKARLLSMFILAGADDGNSLERMTKYQDEAAEQGVFVKLYFLGNSGHITRSIGSQRAGSQQIVEYLSEN